MILHGQLLYSAISELNKTLSPEQIVQSVLVDGIFKAPMFRLADRLTSNTGKFDAFFIRRRR